MCGGGGGTSSKALLYYLLDAILVNYLHVQFNSCLTDLYPTNAPSNPTWSLPAIGGPGSLVNHLTTLGGNTIAEWLGGRDWSQVNSSKPVPSLPRTLDKSLDLSVSPFLFCEMEGCFIKGT